MDTLWTTASVLAALVAVVVAIRIALKPRKFKPKSDAYWKEKARAMQKRYTGQVIRGGAPLVKKRPGPKAGSDR